MFQGKPEWTSLKNFTVWQLSRMLDHTHATADLCVARIDRLSSRRFFRTGYLRVPEWVGARLTVPDQLEHYIQKRDGVRSDVALVKRHHYHPEVTQGTKLLETFYQTMYVPFGQQRHGELTFLRSLKDLRHRLKHGGILWVCQGERRLAGLAYQRRGPTMDLLAVGTADGDMTLVKEGAIAAAYYYSLDLAHQLGCTVVDLRGSRPSLLDGLLRYKAKWGAALYDKGDSYHDLLFRWVPGNEIVGEFFRHTPVIFREGAGYSGLTSDPLRPVRSLWMEGLQRIHQLDSDGPERFTE